MLPVRVISYARLMEKTAKENSNSIGLVFNVAYRLKYNRVTAEKVTHLSLFSFVFFYLVVVSSCLYTALYFLANSYALFTSKHGTVH